MWWIPNQAILWFSIYYMYRNLYPFQYSYIGSLVGQTIFVGGSCLASETKL